MSAEVPLSAAVKIDMDVEQYLQAVALVQELQLVIGQLVEVVAAQEVTLLLVTNEKAVTQDEQTNFLLTIEPWPQLVVATGTITQVPVEVR